MIVNRISNIWTIFQKKYKNMVIAGKGWLLVYHL